MRVLALSASVPDRGVRSLTWTGGRLGGDSEIAVAARAFLDEGGEAWEGGFGAFDVHDRTEYHAMLSLIYFLRWVVGADQIRSHGVIPADPDGAEEDPRVKEMLLEYRPDQPRDWRGRWILMGLDLLDINIDWSRTGFSHPTVLNAVRDYEDPEDYVDMQLALRSPETLIEKYRRIPGWDYPLDHDNPKGRGFDTGASTQAELRAQGVATRTKILERVINNKGRIVDGKQFYRVTSLDKLDPEIRAGLSNPDGGGVRLREPGLLSVSKSEKEARRLGGLTAEGAEGVLLRITVRSSRRALRMEDVDLPGLRHSRVGEHVFAPGAVLRFRGVSEEDGIRIYEVDLVD